MRFGLRPSSAGCCWSQPGRSGAAAPLSRADLIRMPLDSIPRLRRTSMSTPVLANRLEPAQRSAAKVVGLLYLLMMITGIFAELYARDHLIVSGYAVQTAKNIVGSEWLFRLGTVSNLITFAGDMA